MKKLIAMMLSLVVVLLVGGSCSLNSDKETEAEYKARIKKELDAIPVEATGYSLVRELKDKNDFNQKNENVIAEHYDTSFVETTIGLHTYKIRLTADGERSISVWSDTDYGMELSIDGGDLKLKSFNYMDEFKDFGWVRKIIVYDEKVFVIRVRGWRGWTIRYDNYFPDTLFLYDYESNTLKYMGYCESWFNIKITDLYEYELKIIKDI